MLFGGIQLQFSRGKLPILVAVQRLEHFRGVSGALKRGALKRGFLQPGSPQIFHPHRARPLGCIIDPVPTGNQVIGRQHLTAIGILALQQHGLEAGHQVIQRTGLPFDAAALVGRLSIRPQHRPIVGLHRRGVDLRDMAGFAGQFLHVAFHIGQPTGVRLAVVA